MKRSEFLKPLSHDHHQALFLSQRLRRVNEDDVDEVAQAYLAYWHKDGARHFSEEEEILLPVYAEHGEIDDPLVAQVLVEHVKIRSLVRLIERDLEELDSETGLERVREIGRLVHDHVRLEERQLFPKIEEALPAAAIDELSERLSGD